MMLCFYKIHLFVFIYLILIYSGFNTLVSRLNLIGCVASLLPGFTSHLYRPRTHRRRDISAGYRLFSAAPLNGRLKLSVTARRKYRLICRSRLNYSMNSCAVYCGRNVDNVNIELHLVP